MPIAIIIRRIFDEKVAQAAKLQDASTIQEMLFKHRKIILRTFRNKILQTFFVLQIHYSAHNLSCPYSKLQTPLLFNESLKASVNIP